MQVTFIVGELRQFKPRSDFLWLKIVLLGFPRLICIIVTMKKDGESFLCYFTVMCNHLDIYFASRKYFDTLREESKVFKNMVLRQL